MTVFGILPCVCLHCQRIPSDFVQMHCGLCASAETVSLTKVTLRSTVNSIPTQFAAEVLTLCGGI